MTRLSKRSTLPSRFRYGADVGVMEVEATRTIGWHRILTRGVKRMHGSKKDRAVRLNHE